MKTLKGLAIQDIVTEVHSFTYRFVLSRIGVSPSAAQSRFSGPCPHLSTRENG